MCLTCKVPIVKLLPKYGCNFNAKFSHTNVSLFYVKWENVVSQENRSYLNYLHASKNRVNKLQFLLTTSILQMLQLYM